MLTSPYPSRSARPESIRWLAFLLALWLGLVAALPLHAVSLMENLGRGVIVVRTSSSQTYVGWRLLGPEYGRATSFNLYRSENGGAPLKLNSTPLTATTDFVDSTANLTVPNAYAVRAVIDGLEQAPGAAYTLAANAPVQQYLSIPLTAPAPHVTQDNVAHSYSANDATTGDLDGDGEYELILKWEPDNSGLGDNNAVGWSSPTYVDAYKLNGTRLWRINLGTNIRAGSHYTQMTVYDLDGDGKAEFVCKTADGTVDGQGAVIGNAAADWRDVNGRILSGPEYFTVFDGLTGAAMATANYPTRDAINSWGGVGGNGGNDSIGTRADRPQCAIAYLDGQRPSLLLGRGFYGRTVMTAWNWRDGQLTQLWNFDSAQAPWLNHPVTFPYAAAYQTLLSTFSGQGNHNVTVGDFDGDGFDEICIGSMTIDHNGLGLYSTGLRHGDAQDAGDLIPSRPGLEVFGVHENEDNTVPWGTPAAAMFDAKTGEIIWSHSPGVDAGRGRAADIDPTYPGVEAWGGPGGLRRGDTGAIIAATTPNSTNFTVWWDADLTRELLDSNVISKWNWNNSTTAPLFTMTGTSSNNGTKSTPALVADLFGDWREEVVMRTSDNTALRIYTTTIPATNRLYTLMHDRQYRLSVAWQNLCYNQPTNTGFFLGANMAPAPVPEIATTLGQFLAPTAAITGISDDTGRSAADSITSDATLSLGGTAGANATVTIYRAGVGDVGTALADVSGNWNFDYSGTVLPEGAHDFRVSAAAPGGEAGLISDAFTVTVVTTPPPAPVIQQVASGSLIVSGTAAEGGEVHVTLDGSVAMGSALVAPGGAWSVTYAGAVSVGVHGVTATVEDVAGNVSAISTPFPFDTSVATPSILAAVTDAGSVGSGATIADNTIQLSGTATAGDTVTVSRSDIGAIGSVLADEAGAWTFDYTAVPLPEGVVLLSAAAAHGGNSSPASEAFMLTIDSVAPAASSIVRQNPTADIITGAVASVVFRVTFSEPVSGVEAGDFVLTGAVTGSIASVATVNNFTYDVTVDGLAGEGSLRLDLAPGAGIVDGAGNLSGAVIGGESYNRVVASAGNGTWVQVASGGVWSVGDNWLNAVIPQAATHSANFNTLNLTANNTVRLDAPRTVNSMIFGDTDAATLASWTIDPDGSAANVLTLAGTSPTITVNALGVGATATIAARLAGTAGFTKNGTGTLVLNNANPITGTLVPAAGTLRVAPGGSLALTTAITSAVGAAVIVDGGTFSTTGLYTVASGTGSALTLNSGSLSLPGGFRITSSGADGATLRIAGGTFSTADITVQRSSAGTLSYGTGIIFAGGTASATTVNIGTANSNGALSVEGGNFTASGAVVIGSQVTGGRGGGLRVSAGSFTSTDTVNGLVLSRVNGANANNVTEAQFTGGTSTLEKLTLGLTSAVTAGSGTVTINGGTVYLGSGGIVKNGTAGMTTTINLTNGTLGAKANWSTSHPAAFPTGGNITIKAANAADAPFDITLSGVLSGAGGFTKTGGGTLILSGTNSFAGNIALNAGTLAVTGSLAASGGVSVNQGGVLAGTGSVNKAITLQSGGTISPAAGVAGTLSGAAVTWNGGGVIAADLGDTSDCLVLSGALAKGSAGAYSFVFNGAPAIGSVHTLATFGSTTFAASDFSFTGLTGVSGQFSISGNSLLFTVTPPPDAAFNAWAASLPDGQRGATADPDGDGLANLLEFVLGQDAAAAGAEKSSVSVINVGGADYPAITYQRRIDRGGVNLDVLVSPSLDFNPALGAVEVSVTPAATGFETVVARSTVSLNEQPHQFFTLTASVATN